MMTTIKGKTVFAIAFITIGLTFLTVYLNGIHYNRSLTSNLFLSLGIIAVALFTFLTICLYRGTKLINNYPTFKAYEPGSILHHGTPSVPSFDLDLDVGEGIGGLLASIVLWIVFSLAMIVLLFIFEALFWISVFTIFASLYWLFTRALRVVFFKGRRTKGDLSASVVTAFTYTGLYTGWFFLIAFIVQWLR